MIAPKTALLDIFSFAMIAAIGKINNGVVELSALAIETSIY